MGTVRVTQEYNEVLFADAYSVTSRERNLTATNALVLTTGTNHLSVRRYERFSNNGGSSLSASIDDTALSLTVASATGFPSDGNFRIIVDSEIMTVIAVVGTTFKVLRAQEGTSAASHSLDAGVFHVVTAGALASRDDDARASSAFVNRDAAGQAGRIYIPTNGYVARDNGVSWDSMPLWKMSPPVIADFTWENQGTSSVTDVKGVVVLEPQSIASGESLRMLLKAAPTPPYSITIAVQALSGNKTSGSGSQYGFCWRDSASGKVITWGPGCEGTGYPIKFWHTRWASSTSVTTQVANYYIGSTNPYWLRMTDDGTYRSIAFSGDGYRFENITTPESRTTHITPNQVGIFANSYLSSTISRRMISFLHWSQS